MHHQNVSLQNAPSKRTFLTFSAGVVLLLTSLMRSKEYVLMVHFAVIRFGGASGACQLSFLALATQILRTQIFPEGLRHTN